MTILSSLKKLHKKMTGQETDSKTIGGILDSMQENYSGENAGNSDFYETVAEIEVGTLTEDEDIYIYEGFSLNLPVNETLYFNTPDYELIYDYDNGRENSYSYNFNLDTAMPLDTPAYMITGNNTVLLTNDLNIQNSTVKILKKVSGGSSITVDSALSETSENPVQNKVITEALANAGGVKMIHGSLDATQSPTLTITETAEEILEIAGSGDPVILSYTLILGALTLSCFALCHIVGAGDGVAKIVAKVISDIKPSNTEAIDFFKFDIDVENNTVAPTVTSAKAYMLPIFTSEDSGTVLSVDSNGKLKWVTPT